jgi:hypothetical protein
MPTVCIATPLNAILDELTHLAPVGRNGSTRRPSTGVQHVRLSSGWPVSWDARQSASSLGNLADSRQGGSTYSRSTTTGASLPGTSKTLGGHPVPIIPTELASGEITKGDRLAVQLIKPCGYPEMILIIWPPRPSVVEPAKLQTTVAAIVKILAAAQSEYAARRLGGR